MRDLFSAVHRGALAILLLTTIHHVYGAYRYDTPWRLHAGFVAAAAAAVLIASYSVARRPERRAATVAFWIFVIATLAVPVTLIGLFEGFYNHVVKNVLYLGGASKDVMTALFPPPKYELPTDVVFELTGVLQAGLGIMTGRRLMRLVRD